MNEPVDQVVVVGAGECGARAALALRAHGWTGRITLIGNEQVDPYERPPLSKSMLLGSLPAHPKAAVATAQLAVAEVEFARGDSVDAIDTTTRTVSLSSRGVLSYDRMIIATGARARSLPVPGGELAISIRSWDDVVRLRPRLQSGVRVGIIGAGFIGLEVAAAAAGNGCDVTVVETASRVLARGVPEAMATTIAERHEKAGVRLMLDQVIDRLEPGNNATVRIVFADGRTFVCDVVVAGVGAVPNTELAEAAGIAVSNGIVVDDRLQTTDPAIWAAGDCCSFIHPLFENRRMRLESWRNALEQGELAARNLLGADEPQSAVPWFWSDQYDLCLQVAGNADVATSTVTRNRTDGGQVEFGIAADGRIVSAAGVGVGTSIAMDIRVAEILISRRAQPDPAFLADSSTRLKTLLKT
jgi:3-phenylpropionate/trans-cinnamate dioxygenase ferredoxin reductase component